MLLSTSGSKSPPALKPPPSLPSSAALIMPSHGTIASNAFQGLQNAIDASTEQENIDADVSDDLLEQRTDIEMAGDNDIEHGHSASARAALPSLWRESLAEASHGVSESTHFQYMQ